MIEVETRGKREVDYKLLYKMLLYIRSNDGKVDEGDIADHFDIGLKTACWHADILRHAGLVGYKEPNPTLGPDGKPSELLVDIAKAAAQDACSVHLDEQNHLSEARMREIAREEVYQHSEYYHALTFGWRYPLRKRRVCSSSSPGGVGGVGGVP